MRRKHKALIVIFLSPFIVLSLYIGFLFVTYIDQSITTGQKYGFTIGANKNQTYKDVIQLLEDYPNLVIYISYGQRAGDKMTFAPSRDNYEKAQSYNHWTLLLDGKGEFFNVIKLIFVDDNLYEIYRHRKYFEAP